MSGLLRIEIVGAGLPRDLSGHKAPPTIKLIPHQTFELARHQHVSKAFAGRSPARAKPYSAIGSVTPFPRNHFNP